MTPGTTSGIFPKHSWDKFQSRGTKVGPRLGSMGWQFRSYFIRVSIIVFHKFVYELSDIRELIICDSMNNRRFLYEQKCIVWKFFLRAIMTK